MHELTITFDTLPKALEKKVKAFNEFTNQIASRKEAVARACEDITDSQEASWSDVSKAIAKVNEQEFSYLKSRVALAKDRQAILLEIRSAMQKSRDSADQALEDARKFVEARLREAGMGARKGDFQVDALEQRLTVHVNQSPKVRAAMAELRAAGDEVERAREAYEASDLLIQECEDDLRRFLTRYLEHSLTAV